MKYSYLIMLLFLLAGLSTACTSAKERNLNEFRVMMKEVEKEHDSFEDEREVESSTKVRSRRHLLAEGFISALTKGL
jgi:poly(A) polymerase Pap1